MGNRVQSVLHRDLGILGLSDAEVTVYGVLAQHPTVTVSELRRLLPRNQLNRVTVSLRGLEGHGLVKRTRHTPPTFMAVPPDVALEELLRHREQELQQARVAASTLIQQFRESTVSPAPSDLVEIVVGEREVARHVATLYRSAREHFWIMTRPPWFEGQAENRDNTTELHRHAIETRNIIDVRFLETWGLDAIRDDARKGESFRSLPRVPMKLMISDDQMALIHLENSPQGVQSSLLVRRSALLAALIEVFDTLWQLATPFEPLHQTADGETSDERARDAEYLIVRLLAGGMPDDMIARELGISLATLHRRIQALKARLGASSRFQAGVQAVLRGWLARSPTSGL